MIRYFLFASEFVALDGPFSERVPMGVATGSVQQVGLLLDDAGVKELELEPSRLRGPDNRM